MSYETLKAPELAKSTFAGRVVKKPKASRPAGGKAVVPKRPAAKPKNTNHDHDYEEQ